MKPKIVLLILVGLLITGFFLRIKGIVANYSFWADEAYITSLARDLIQGKISFLSLTKLPGAIYQPINILLIAGSFGLFGVSEWVARLPGVFISSAGIIFVYLIAKQFSDENGGLLSAFLYSITQLNLANATQAKPYASLSAMFLVEIYLITRLSEKKIQPLLYHLLTIVLLITASLIHIIGIFFWIPYLFFVYSRLNIRWLLVIGLLITVIIFRLIIINPLSFIGGNYVFNSNNLTYLRELFWKNYGFILLPALFGAIISWKQNKTLILGIATYTVILIFIWNFRAVVHNVRYLVPLFGIIFIFFGVFWAQVGEKLLHKNSLITCLIVAVILYLGGNKIVRRPQIFYSPNADLYGDVQIANYKDLFEQLKQKFPNYQQLVIFNDIPDAQRWYLDKQPDAYFMKSTSRKPETHPLDGKMIYKTLDHFLTQKSMYSQGLLIVEDWESLLPEDIKQYAKKSLKQEIRVENLDQAKDDPWPLAVYSWGIN